MASKAPIETVCYCGGTLEETTSQHLWVCSTCKRLWFLRNRKFQLLVPWKGFRVAGSDNCPRCGGETTYQVRTHRYKCNDGLCNYGWRKSEDRKSLLENRLTEQMKDLRKKMADSNDPTVFIDEYAELKGQLERLGKNDY